jgi:hypothetical protein
MASILPIAGAVAGNFIAPGIGGAIGGGLGSLASNYIQKGNISGTDALAAAGSGLAGYAAGGGFNDTPAAAATTAAQGPGMAPTAAGAGVVPPLPAAAVNPNVAPNIPPTPYQQPAPGATVAPNIPNVGPAPSTPTWNLANPPAQAPAPVAATPPVTPTAPAVTPTGWGNRQSGMFGLTNSQMAGYGGLGALAFLSGSTGGSTPTTVDHPTPVLSRTPTNRQFAAAPEGYRPGHDPEHTYFQMARGGRVPRFDEGGEIDGGHEGSHEGGMSGAGSMGGGAVAEGGGYQGGGGDKGGGSFGGSIDSGSGMSSVGSGPGPVGGGDPWGAGISNTGYSGGLEAGGLGMGGGGGYSAPPIQQYGGGATGPSLPAGPQMATLGVNRHIVQPAAGYRPGFSPQHTFIQTMAEGGIARTRGYDEGGVVENRRNRIFGNETARMPMPDYDDHRRLQRRVNDPADYAGRRYPPDESATMSMTAPRDPGVEHIHHPWPYPDADGYAEGGTITTDAQGRTIKTMPDGARFVQTKTPSFGLDRMLGIPGLLGAYASDDEGWQPTDRAAPVLATEPIDRHYTPAPAGYRPGYDPEWTYFHDPVPVPKNDTKQMAGGGITGGLGGVPGYIRGDGDGLSDSIRGTIEGHEPVDLSSGEFVVPAHIVSGLGNGSSEAGAKKLYNMMKRVRAARARMGTDGDKPISDSVMPA